MTIRKAGAREALYNRKAPFRVPRRNDASGAIGSAGLDGFLEFLGGAECDLLAGLDRERFAGGGVAAHAGGALADLEDAQPDDSDALALLQVFGDPCDHVGQDRLGGFLRQVMFLGQRCRQMLECDGGWSRCFLRHIWPSSLVEWLSSAFVKPVRAGKTPCVVT